MTTVEGSNGRKNLVMGFREVVVIVVAALICAGFASYVGAQMSFAQQEVINETASRRLSEHDEIIREVSTGLARMQGVLFALAKQNGIDIPEPE